MFSKWSPVCKPQQTVSVTWCYGLIALKFEFVVLCLSETGTKVWKPHIQAVNFHLFCVVVTNILSFLYFLTIWVGQVKEETTSYSSQFFSIWLWVGQHESEQSQQYLHSLILIYRLTTSIWKNKKTVTIFTKILPIRAGNKTHITFD